MHARRRLSGSAAVLLLVLAAAGCAGGAAPRPDSSPSAADRSAGEATDQPSTSPPRQPDAAPAVTAGLPVELCDFTDPTVPKANPEFPFRDLLTEQTRLSTDPQVVASVRSIQQVLLAEGFADESSFSVDGDYGPQTAAAVRRFQQQAGITVDGRVGQETWTALGGNCWKYH